MSLGMQVTGDDRDVDMENLSIQESSFISKMYFYGRELCFVLALLFTSYAALQNSPPKVSKSPLPVRFFPHTSLVADFYHGQLSSAFERVADSDVSFIMYYAPWDAESQSTKDEFSAVAQYYYKQVYFAAINCWQPMGECRQQFSKIQHFPVVIAYTQHTKGIQYKGVKDANHMIKFIQSILRPLSRVEHPSDLINMMSSHDAVVLGLFDFSGNIGSPGFHIFYSAALKLLEKDPLRDVGFAVVTSEVAAARFGEFNLPAVRLYMWNETLEYSPLAEYSVDALTKWISQNVHQVSVWVNPPGVKSLTLSPYVERGSVLILFTPRNSLLLHNHYYDMMREIGLDYFNCDRNPWIQDLSVNIAKKRSKNLKEQENLHEFCQFIKHSSRYSKKENLSFSSSTKNGDNSDGREKCTVDLYVAGDLFQELDMNVHCTSCTDAMKCSQDELYQYSYLNSRDQCFHYMTCNTWNTLQNVSSVRQNIVTSMLTNIYDERSAVALLTATAKERCQQWQWAQRVHRQSLPKSNFVSDTPSNFHGLACRTNQSLSLLAMDALQFHQFAEGLGLDVLSFPDQTAVVIFNAELESTYVLSGPVNYDSLVDFMVNYTGGLLDRNLRNSPRQWSTSLNKYQDFKMENCSNVVSEMCIQELTSSNFEKYVMAANENVVLLYHSPYCAFCHSASHIYLTVARYFRFYTSLKFYRIDGENNDLPWEFTMDRYPTLLFFPAFRKSESRVYPQNLPLTVQNLVNFVLANLRGLSHMEGLLSLCVGWSGLDDISAKDCLDLVRAETIELIAETLAQYRKSLLHQASRRGPEHHLQSLHVRTKDLLFKLRTLKEVNWLMGSVDRISPSSVEYKKIKLCLESYYFLSHSYYEAYSIKFSNYENQEMKDIHVLNYL